MLLIELNVPKHHKFAQNVHNSEQIVQMPSKWQLISPEQIQKCVKIEVIDLIN